MSLLSLFKLAGESFVGLAIARSTYLFPSIEVAHLLGLTLLLAVVFWQDIQLLGWASRRSTLEDLWIATSPLFWFGLALTLVTGTLLFFGEPLKCYDNPAFWWKMALLLPAILFHILLFSERGRRISATAFRRSAGLISLALWFGVALAGRIIGFI